MAFYSSKCINCTERSRRVVKEIRYKDGGGTYTVKYYECDNVGCDVVHRKNKKLKKIKKITHKQ